jgi:hypothetical protein
MGMVIKIPPKNRPQRPPHKAPFSPEFDAITGIVEAYYLLFSVIAFPDNAEVLHVESASSELANGGFGSVVVGEDGDDGGSSSSYCPSRF